MKYFFGTTCLLVVFNFALMAQNSVVLRPGMADGKVGEVYSLEPNTVWTNDLLKAMAWTFQGTPGTLRGLFQFDLSSVPAGSTIDSAFLSLYAPNPPNTQFHSGDNASYLRRITSGWDQATITWNNQPLSTNIHQVTLPETTDEFQDYPHINVTALVRDMVNDPLHSFGFMFMQQDETPLTRMSFCSSTYPDDTKHPQLEIYFTPPTCTSLVIQPGENGKDSEVFSLQPNNGLTSDTWRGMSWTFQGEQGEVRGFIDFDFTTLPEDAEIELAYLSLYSPDPPTTEFHSGTNNALLQRVTSTWTEDGITWNNQPSTTTVHQVSLDEASYDFQDYVNIDVTQLVKDMRTDPSNSFGFMIRQADEEPLRRMSFCPGEYPNPKKHPRLEICYSSSVAVESAPKNQLSIVVYPNPCYDRVRLDILIPSFSIRVQIVDIFGKIVFDQSIDPSQGIDVSSFAPGMYGFRCIGDDINVLGETKMVKL
jgi:hypothetical protein